jgi:peptide/nickel transport system substrate-binding protein
VERGGLVARPLALAAALAAALLAVSGAGGAPAQTPKRGGTVVVGMNSLAEPPCLGWAAVCLGRWQWRDKVLALPFRTGPNGLRSDLVERYSLTKRPFTVTFYIRPQARWSDGVPISARDFVFAYEAYREHSGLPDHDPFKTAIRSARAVDAKTVRFVFRTPRGDWRSKWLLQFPPLPRHALRGEKLGASEALWRDGIVNPKTGDPIGSGPFLVGRWDRGRELVLVRNPLYWGRNKAYVDRLVLRFVPGTIPDTEQALKAGDIDVGVVSALQGELQSHAGFDVLTTPWAGWQHFEFRVGPGGHRALRNKNVRRALAYGIDRVALVRTLFGSDRHLLDNTIYLRNERNYRPNWNVYRYRPALARRLLEQVGCTPGADGIYACGGERLRLRFLTTSGVPVRTRTLELVQSQLRRAGVEVQPVYVPNLTLFGTVLPSGNFDAALFGFFKAAPEDANSPYRCGVESYSGYCSRLVTADLDQLAVTADPARRIAVANRIDRRLAADVPTLPLYQASLTYVVRKQLRGVVPNGYSTLTSDWSVWNAENWWLER